LRAWLVHRKGRVLLNPIGCMGLNGGIQDAVSLADKLVRIVLDGESERLLDLYDLQRRTVAIELQETPRSRRSGRPQAQSR
jgi:2-polyprenyl-6-methoxyphenol hydroxylase-like FAD-dependent oxidoreductase